MTEFSLVHLHADRLKFTTHFLNTALACKANSLQYPKVFHSFYSKRLYSRKYGGQKDTRKLTRVNVRTQTLGSLFCMAKGTKLCPMVPVCLSVAAKKSASISTWCLHSKRNHRPVPTNQPNPGLITIKQHTPTYTHRTNPSDHTYQRGR